MSPKRPRPPPEKNPKRTPPEKSRKRTPPEKNRRRTPPEKSRRRTPAEPEARRENRSLREDLVLQASLEAYGAIRHEGRLADRALDFTLRTKRHLYSTERRAVAERVYALLRRQRLVDFALERARGGWAKLGSGEQDLLRLAAARVLEGESAEAVARSVALRPPDAEGLRRFSDAAAQVDALPQLERYAVKYSMPEFLAQKLLAQLGAEAEPAAAALNQRAPLTARVNTLKTTREALEQRLGDEEVYARPTRLSPLGLTLETRVNAFALASFRDGLFELQDEGSQLLGMLVDAPPTRVIDACAGAGGKTLQLSAQMKNRGELFALDVDARRLEEMKKRARRAGCHNVRTQAIPAGDEAETVLDALGPPADRVLVDAPCSGTGTFRRKPDARYRLTPELLAEHVERQRALLERFAPRVKPGGRLIYGTCSLLRDENEEVVEGFLARHKDFALLPPADRLGEALGAQVTRNGYLRLFPHVHGTDGFFGAILKRG